MTAPDTTHSADLGASTTARRSRLLLWTIGLAVVFAGGWIAAWQVAASKSEAIVGNWIEARRAAGETIEHGPMVFSGFPLSVDITLDAVHWSGGDGATQRFAAAPSLVLSARPWRSGTLTIQAPSGARASVAGQWGALTGDGKHAVVEVDLGRTAAERVALSVRELMVTLPGNVALASVERIDATIDPTPARDPNTGSGELSASLTVDAALRGVLPAGMIDPPFDGKANGSFRAALLGRVKMTDGVAGLTRWRDTGGLLRVERLRLDWLPLDVTAEGTLTLDRELRPEGEAVAEIWGLADAVDRLAAQERIEPGAAAVLKLAAAAFAKPASDGTGRRVVRAPVRIQDGRLSVGSAVLARIGSIAR